MTEHLTAQYDDMALPPGKTCADCACFKRCVAFIGAKYINNSKTRCDWSPSAFQYAAPIERHDDKPSETACNKSVTTQDGDLDTFGRPLRPGT